MRGGRGGIEGGERGTRCLRAEADVAEEGSGVGCRGGGGRLLKYHVEDGVVGGEVGFEPGLGGEEGGGWAVEAVIVLI